ncbi:hypothetical protein [Ferruginibacter sp.]|uniref:hypothetical protein n=1 Tax=Ferruginibacter sp. TaxID=1940288 RepID=UPI001997FFD6|nr:hypothetical protein [Ferruginibacter sp.]MBC7627402.1 hypothetical protein [Ferruginibacter sp.]
MNFVKTNKNLLITIIVALVLLSVIWIWKIVEIGNVKKAVEKDRQALKAQAIIKIVQSNEQQLKALAKAYVWAVRTEMMQGNINEVNLFGSDMIKEKNFQVIAIANDKGIIVSSTNKKQEGQSFSTIGKEEALTSNDTNINNAGDSILVMTSPIMGFNNRLGTLFIKYAVPLPTFSE